MLPFQPESLDAAKARVSEALSSVYDPDMIKGGLVQRPGAQRRHVFDLNDGIRVILSVDRDGSELFLHASFSLHPGTQTTLRAFLKGCHELPQALLAQPLQLVDEIVTNRAVHHVYRLPATLAHLNYRIS